jgi:hypothetical protein
MKNTANSLRATRRNALMTVNATKALYVSAQARLRTLRKMFPLHRLGSRLRSCGCCSYMVVSRNLNPAQQAHFNLVRGQAQEALNAYLAARHTYFMLSQLPG